MPGPRTVRSDRAREGSAARLAAAVAVLSALALASPGAAQAPDEDGRCDLMENEFVRSIATGQGERITYISGPVLFVCADGTEIRADSVVERSASGLRELIGDVEITAPDSRLVADRVHRFADRGRTRAWGGVEVEDRAAGTRMHGDSLLLLEAGALRDRDHLRMTGGRPFAVLRLEGTGRADTAEPEDPGADVERRRGGDPGTSPPDSVFGDRLYMEGRSVFRAGGSVRVRRPDLEAFGDSLDYEGERGRVRLEGAPDRPARVDSERYDLAARTLDLRIEGGELTEAVAREEAELTGEDVRMNAPLVRIFFAGGEIDRLVAVGEGAVAGEADAEESGEGVPEAPGTPEGERRRAEAVADEYVLIGDSIEVLAPADRLERVTATGAARGEALGRDTLNTPETPEVIRRDWLEGDTVVAHFVTAPRAVEESAGGEAAAEGEADPDRSRSRLDRLVASGNARSLYRMTRREPAADPDTATDTLPADTAAAEESGTAGRRGRPAIHYVVGERITIVLDGGEVDRMEVLGQTRGLYLDPTTGTPIGSGTADGPAGRAPSGGGLRP